MYIVNSSDIFKCFDNIENSHYDFELDFRKESDIDGVCEKCTGIIFDKCDKYFVLVFEKMLLIYSFLGCSEGKLVQKY